jgi:hypothetical protein
MQAVICKNQHDPDCKDLTDELDIHGINYVFINSLLDLKQGLAKLNQDEPFLLYRNSFMRISFPHKILTWHKENPNFDFVSIKCGTERINVSYYPKEVEIFRDTVITKKSLLDIPTWPFALNTYQDQPFEVTFMRPKYTPPAIFVLAHNRSNYLKLSLNSLFYSIDETVPVYIFINGNNPSTGKVARSFVDKYSNVDVIQINQNIHHSAVNIALQWSNAETFVVWEDDFILPPITKDLFPHWPYQFVHRLNHFDLVGWTPITENIPGWHSRLGNTFPRKDHVFYDWIPVSRKEEKWRESIDNPPLLGQALAMSRSFWNKCKKRKPWFVPLDTEIHSRAKNYCIPGLRGYHIGWNQEMDGYPTPTRPPDPPLENTVLSLKTGQTKTIRLDAI